MLISTLAMKSLTLVLVTLLLIHCQAIVVRDDAYEVAPKSFAYSDSGSAASEVGYRSDDYYKPFRRGDGRSYQSVENNQETDYSEQDAENYPFTQRSHRQQIARRRTPAKKLQVEQYLKEVTPTTKTVYNQRPGNYLRSSDQSRDRVIEQTEESQRGSLKPSVQYIVQSDAQERLPSQQQVQYVVGEATSSAQLKQSAQESSAALAAYQNALLAHQKLLETEGHDETSRSSIYVTHSIPKKPIRKIVKPAVKDEEVEQYINSQQFGLQQKQIGTYERQQPAEVRYQAKIEDSNRHPDFQASTETPTYQNEEERKQQFRQHLQGLTRYQSEGQLYQHEKLIQPHQITQYQQLSLNRQGNRPVTFNQQPQVSADITRPSPETAEYKTPLTTEERASVQYQQPTYLKQGPKYLPEPKNRYQSLNLNEEEQYQQTLSIPLQNQDALLKYQAAIAKLQSERLAKARQQRLRPQVTYQQQELDTQTAGYALQYPAENQEAPVSETEYVRIGGTNKYRTTENTSAAPYRQPNQNPNIRYYRNPGRPAVSYSHYQ